MKRIDALSGMRGCRLLLVFLAGYTTAGTAQEVEDVAIELNPLEYVPLAVGNSWTYEHSYWNNSYSSADTWYDIEYLKPFEIPGYPHGAGNALPPDSLLLPVDRILTIEITHTERIDGREYFVFSAAEYDWPPLPDFFWAGKKVRWSDEGVLVFRWNGQEVPIYDFGELQNGYTVALLGESSTPVNFDFYRGKWFYEAPKTSIQNSLVVFSFSYSPLASVLASCRFIRGYGMGLFHIRFSGLSAFVPFFENALTGLSANIDGEEIWYDQLDPDAIPPLPEPPAVVWGQLGQLNKSWGFDFSSGTETDFYSEDADIALDQFPAIGEAGSDSPSFLCSHTCDQFPLAKIVDLGRVDFGHLVSEEGIADLQPAQTQAQIADPQAGHTYAIETREGGTALMHVLKIVLVGTRGRINFGMLVDYIFFEWVYYPPAALSPDGTAVQPTSWGALKRSILRMK